MGRDEFLKFVIVIGVFVNNAKIVLCHRHTLGILWRDRWLTLKYTIPAGVDIL